MAKFKLMLCMLFTFCVVGIVGGCEKEAEQKKDDTPNEPKAANKPESSVVQPFNGKDLSGWKIEADAKKHFWTVGQVVTVKDKGGKDFKTTVEAGGEALLVNSDLGPNIYTEEKFGSGIIELEFMVLDPKANSGLFVMGEYEVQIEAAKPNTPLENTDHGSIVQEKAPAEYAGCPLGEWQTYRIEYVAPKFGADGKKTDDMKFVKITLNGKTVHENVVVKEVSFGCLTGMEHATGPLMLQGLEGRIAFRNIKFTPVDK